jgi:transcriptional regulator with XRE-family HTH domain
VQTQDLRTFLKQHRLRIHPETTVLGTSKRLPTRHGRPVTQEEIAECIGVSRVWYAMLESRADVRTSPALLDRLASALMLTAEERASLFNLALPALRLEAVLGAIPDNGAATVTHSPLTVTPANIEDAAKTFWRLREQYLYGAWANDSSLRPRIVNSWDRCRTREVDPSKREAPHCMDISERRGANERLLRAAEPVVSYLSEEFGQTGYVIFLSDAQGNLLRTVGDLSNRREFSKHGIEEGCDLNEASFGTNAVGTAIVDRRPMQLSSAEHFCEGATWFTCSASPIFLPGERETAGVIDLSAFYKCAHPQTLGLIMHAALEIEERLASL